MNSDTAESRQGSFLYQEYFQRSADAFLIIEGDTFVDCNQATVDMLRYRSRDELLQTHPSQLSPEFQPDGQLSFEKANEMIGIAIREGSHRFEWDHKRADGEVFPVEVLLTAVPRGDGVLVHTVWRDLTERKRLERELFQAHKMEAIGKLTGGIAHDFNNLLVAILGNAELLSLDLDEDSGPTLHEYVSEIMRAGERAADLVGQLLAYSRKQVLNTQVVDMSQVLTGLMPMLRHLIGEDVAVSSDLADRPLPVLVDPGRLEQVIMNLVTNARDAMPSGGELRLDTRLAHRPAWRNDRGADFPAGEYAILSVTDDGAGIDPRIRIQIFDPFFTTRIAGTGLGLSTVLGIVNQSGGDILVEDGPSGGTRFTVLLPLSSETTMTVESPQSPAPPIKSCGETILLVEDESGVSRVAQRVLEGEGYTVYCAENGREALELIESRNLRFDLLLTDVVMPTMGGPELARRLTAERPDLKVLYASGYTDEALTSRGVLDEGVTLLMKPYSITELKQGVRNILDGKDRT